LTQDSQIYTDDFACTKKALQPNIVKLLGFEILAAGKNLFFYRIFPLVVSGLSLIV
jgi:hypothetical protein